MNSVFLELKFKMLKMSFLGYFINEISKTQKKKKLRIGQFDSEIYSEENIEKY